MRAYFGERRRERAHFDRASAILDSNSEKAWGETGWKEKYLTYPLLPTHFSQANMAANLRSRAPKRKRWRFERSSFVVACRLDYEADVSSFSPLPFALRFEMSASLSLHGGNLTLSNSFDTKLLHWNRTWLKYVLIFQMKSVHVESDKHSVSLFITERNRAFS